MSVGFKSVGADAFLGSFPVESIIECDAFKAVDEFIIKWLTIKNKFA